MISFARTARAGAASLLLLATALHFNPAAADDGNKPLIVNENFLLQEIPKQLPGEFAGAC